MHLSNCLHDPDHGAARTQFTAAFPGVWKRAVSSAAPRAGLISRFIQAPVRRAKEGLKGAHDKDGGSTGNGFSQNQDGGGQGGSYITPLTRWWFGGNRLPFQRWQQKRRENCKDPGVSFRLPARDPDHGLRAPCADRQRRGRLSLWRGPAAIAVPGVRVPVPLPRPVPPSPLSTPEPSGAGEY